jgi:hypothetical protein
MVDTGILALNSGTVADGCASTPMPLAPTAHSFLAHQIVPLIVSQCLTKMTAVSGIEPQTAILTGTAEVMLHNGGFVPSLGHHSIYGIPSIQCCPIKECPSFLMYRQPQWQNCLS